MQGQVGQAAACRQSSSVLCVEQRAGHAAPCRAGSGAVLCSCACPVQDPCSGAGSVQDPCRIHPCQPCATRWCSAPPGFLLLLGDFSLSEARKEAWTQPRSPLGLSPLRWPWAFLPADGSCKSVGRQESSRTVMQGPWGWYCFSKGFRCKPRASEESDCKYGRRSSLEAVSLLGADQQDQLSAPEHSFPQPDSDPPPVPVLSLPQHQFCHFTAFSGSPSEGISAKSLDPVDLSGLSVRVKGQAAGEQKVGGDGSGVAPHKSCPGGQSR